MAKVEDHQTGRSLNWTILNLDYPKIDDPQTERSSNWTYLEVDHRRPMDPIQKTIFIKINGQER